MPATIEITNAPVPNRPLARRRNGKVMRRPHTPSLRPGRVWKSFEQFRLGGQSELTALASGEIGQLLTRVGSFRLLHEEDFQRLYGLARDVERIQNGLRVILAAARSAEKHRDEVTLDALLEAVALCANIPPPPIRSGNSSVAPEGLALDDDDLEGIELNPNAIPRPYPDGNANE